MKAQMKAIIASAVVIALCLAAVGGVTYSWFSDSEESNIDITAGKIDVTATWGDLSLSSSNYSSVTIVDTVGVEHNFPFDSGKAKVEEASDYGSLIRTITVKNMVPGDSISFDITGVTLKTDINVLFSYGCAIQIISGPDTNLFDLEMTQMNDGSNFGGYDNYYLPGGTDTAFTGVHVNLAMKTTAGNEYQGCSYKIMFFVKAVQANMPSSTTTAINTTGENQIALQSTRGEAPVTASLTFDGTGLDGQSLTTSVISSSASGYTTTDVGTDAVLGGVEVTSTAGDHALQGTWTTISFKVPGNYSNSDINVYHNNVKIIDAGSVVAAYTGSVRDFTVSYNNTTGETTISFETSLGFSKYYVAGNFPVACDGKFYKTIDNAISAAKLNSRIVLLKDITRDNDANGSDYILVDQTKKITIDLHGHDIDLGNNTLYVYGSLEITGKGEIKSSGTTMYVMSNNNTSKSNSLTVGPGVTVTNTEGGWAVPLMYYYSTSDQTGYHSYNTTVTIKGTVNGIIGTNGYMKDNAQETLSKMILDGATINGLGYFPGNIIHEFKNSTFNSETTALMFKGGYVTIENCRFNCEKTLSVTPAFVSCGNGGFDTNAAVYIEQKSGYAQVKSVTLSNNTFNTPGGFIGDVVQYSPSSDELITINPDGSTTKIILVNEYAAKIHVVLVNSNGQNLPCDLYFKNINDANNYTADRCASEFEMTVEDGSFGEVTPLQSTLDEE